MCGWHPSAEEEPCDEERVDISQLMKNHELRICEHLSADEEPYYEESGDVL
jgi:hypothetical protein